MTNVLMVEDNPGDVDMIREVLEGSRLNVELSVACDGVEALRMLREEPGGSKIGLPDLILLDLNLPRIDGRRILSEIKGDAALSHIPVVILTSSTADRDVAQSYALGANCYVAKGTDLPAFQDVLGALERFWFSVVVLPPKPGASADIDRLEAGSRKRSAQR